MYAVFTIPKGLAACRTAAVNPSISPTEFLRTRRLLLVDLCFLEASPSDIESIRVKEVEGVVQRGPRQSVITALVSTSDGQRVRFIPAPDGLFPLLAQYLQLRLAVFQGLGIQDCGALMITEETGRPMTAGEFEIELQLIIRSAMSEE